MSKIILKNVNISTIIKKTNKLLTVKELLNIIGYDIDSLYIDNFWENVKDDKWVFYKNDLILWLGYSDVNKGKEKIIKFLKHYFVEKEDYKILNNTEFNIKDFCSPAGGEQNIYEEKRGGHNKQYLITSPDCFKELCMHIGTNKSKEIKKYYIELEKVFKFYLEYQRIYYINSNKQIQALNKLKMHNMLIDKFKGKKCIYLVEVKENELIKFGVTDDIFTRIRGLNTSYGSQCLILNIFEHLNNRDLEKNVLNKDIIKQNLANITINNILCKEIIKLSSDFTYDNLVNIIKKCIIDTHDLTNDQKLEKEKVILERKRLLLFNQILDSDQAENIEQIFNINNKFLDLEMKINTIAKRIDNIELNCKNCNSNLESKIEIEVNNLKNNINDIKDIIENNLNENRRDTKCLKKSRGKPIQRIDPNDLTKVLKVYDSMIVLLRNDENIKVNKHSIQEAIKFNKVFAGYRWNYVEFGNDPNIANVADSVERKKEYNIVQHIIKLNSEKDEVIKVYITKKECMEENNLSRHKLEKIVNQSLLYNDHYYCTKETCSEELLASIDFNKYKFIPSNAKSIILTNISTNEETLYNSIDEVILKFGIHSKKIKEVIEKNIIYKNCSWRYK